MKEIEDYVKEIRGKEHEILDQFSKAFVAAHVILGKNEIEWLVTHIQLNQQMTNENGEIGWKFWFSFNDNPTHSTTPHYEDEDEETSPYEYPVGGYF